jgi:hypothetical protein
MSEEKQASTPSEVHNEWVKENPGVDPREGRGPEVAEIAEALDTRTDPDELGDLVDPWDEWLTDQIEYDDLPDDLKEKAREGLKPVDKSMSPASEPGLGPVSKHPEHGDEKVPGRHESGSDGSIES